MSVFKFFYQIIVIILGCALAAFGTTNFLLPNQLSSGGFAGIATILYYFFDVQMSITILILNIPIFILGYLKLGKKFIFKTIFATFLYSKFIDLFEGFGTFTEDRLLASLYGGFFIGIGLALTFKVNTSTGGTDLIAHLAQSYNANMRISNVLTFMDIVIVISNLVAFREFEVGLYSTIAIFIIGKMIDVVFEGINFCKIINLEIKRGATALYAKGSYSQKNKMVIMCVSKRRDIERIKSISKKIDDKSFIIVTDAREVYGLGFKS